MTKKNENDEINYNFTIYGPQGKGYTYSSKTREVKEVEDDPSNYDYNYNYGTINKLSSCLVILIILSWL